MGSFSDLRGGRFLLKASALALGVGLAAPASAQCTADPTNADIVNCTGGDADGYQTDDSAVETSSSYLRLTVQPDATLSRGAGGVAALYNSASRATITVHGLIDGSGGDGLLVNAVRRQVLCDQSNQLTLGCAPGTIVSDGRQADVDVVIGEAGKIIGVHGIIVRRSTDAPRSISFSLDNAGHINGTAGAAILLDLPTMVNGATFFDSVSITNQASGYIGGIEGGAAAIGNSGLINGEAGRSALSGRSFAITNAAGGIIRSDGASTIVTTDGVSISNLAGGIIENLAGGNAIETAGALTFQNEGTINGSVVSTAAAGMNSLVDISNGVINGDLRLGAGDDILRGRLNNVTGMLDGITGTVDGGAGIDTLALEIDQDIVIPGLSGGILPTNFEQIGLHLLDNAQARLAMTATISQGIQLSGAGTLINDGTFITNGTALVVTPNFNTQPTSDPFAPPRNQPIIFDNNGAVSASLSSGSAFAVVGANEMVNRGTITAQGGNGVQVVDSLLNSGRIEASGAAVSITFGRIDNKGEIVSTGATGLFLSGSSNLAESTNSGTISGHTVGLAMSGRGIVNSGTISGGNIGVQGGGSFPAGTISSNGMGIFTNAAGGVVSGGNYSINGLTAMTVVNAGMLDGDVNLGASVSNQAFVNQFQDAGGTVLGKIIMGNGNDLLLTDIVQPAGRMLAGATGGVDAGGGVDTIRYRVAADAATNLARPDSFEILSFLLENGAALSLRQAGSTDAMVQIQGSGTLDLAADIAAVGTSAIQMEEASGGLTITNRGTLTVVGASSRAAAVVVGTGAFINQGQIVTATGGYGAWQLTSFTNDGTLSIDGGVGLSDVGTIVNNGVIDDAGSGGAGVTGFGLLDNRGVIRVDQTAVSDAGARLWSGAQIVNSGTIESRLGDAIYLTMGGIGNRATGVIVGKVRGQLSIDNAGSMTGGIDMFGSDSGLANSGTVTGDILLNASRTTIINDGTIQGDLTTSMQGERVIINRGLIAGNVGLTSGADYLMSSGRITGNIDLGADDDQLFLRGAWAVDGTISGGAGTDLATVAFAGTDADPQRLPVLTDFEQLTVESGVGTVAGTAGFQSIFLDGGRLIGQSGSAISGNIYVAQGATFASAGIVNGNIQVGGTLSSGNSLGTMTVNGNVGLTDGSNLLMELTPTVSDGLVINGTLTIWNGARLTLTGDRPATPGIYDLVTATGGISGSFGTNVTQDDRIIGMLRYSQNAIELISMLQLRGGATTQAAVTADYLNSLLVDGSVTTRMLAALPLLVGADGYADSAALSALSPEPYASVVQIGVENGLAISRTLRTVRLAGLNDEGGLFVFGQAYGSWRDFDANSRGVAAADISSSGYLGGIGYGNTSVGGALFVGRSDNSQPLRGIAAHNEADGLFFGGRLHYAAGGFSAGASLIFDRAAADTSRNPVGGETARSHYDLHGTTIDGWFGYGVALGDDWQLGPQVGLTHVRVTRDGMVESGGGAFALNVAKQKYDATLLTADLKVEAPGAQAIRPWAAVGVRYWLDGKAVSATGGFADVASLYTVAGAGRKAAVPHAGAGLDFSLGSNMSLFVNGDIEFNGSNGARHVNTGLAIRF